MTDLIKQIIIELMKFRDKEKNLLSGTLLKTAEYIMAIVVLGQIVAGKFSLVIFLIGLGIFLLLVIFSLMLSSFTKEE